MVPYRQYNLLAGVDRTPELTWCGLECCFADDTTAQAVAGVDRAPELTCCGKCGIVCWFADDTTSQCGGCGTGHLN